MRTKPGVVKKVISSTTSYSDSFLIEAHSPDATVRTGSWLEGETVLYLFGIQNKM
jgi:hypothetical protein